jgi:Alr-MurF fusion protein
LLLYTIEKIAEIIHASWVRTGDLSATVLTLAYDTRRMQQADSALFIALVGKGRDGHAFLQDAYEKGARLFLISNRDCWLPSDPSVSVLQVPNTLEALQVLATWHRQQFDYPVLAITGSNGKTVIKEWLYTILSHHLKIVRSPSSFNSQLGVALSLWQLSNTQDLAIVEAGISQTGEMERLASMIQPTQGIFTNVGDAHDEGFTSKWEKAQEKAKLFQHASVVFYCSDHDMVGTAIQSLKSLNPDLEVITWGQQAMNKPQLCITQVEKGIRSTHLKTTYHGQEISWQVPFTDDASLENIGHVLLYVLWLGMAVADIQQGIDQLQPVAMRLELKKGIHQCSVINDSYSADLHSLRVALDFLVRQKQHATHTVILSDILESGISEQALYTQVANILKAYQVDRMIGIGPALIAHQHLFQAAVPRLAFFFQTADFLAVCSQMHWDREAILIKGARTFGFERIDQVLTEQAHGTVLEIHLGRLLQNLRSYRSVLHANTRLMAMVKAFSYGSGSFEIASRLQDEHVDYLAVAYADEGAALRNAGIRLPIMVMNAEENSFPIMVQHQLEPVLFSVSMVHAFTRFLNQAHAPYPVHLEIETGMHRLGLLPSEIEQISPILSGQQLKVVSVFSHLAASEDANQDSFTQLQVARFEQACDHIQQVAGAGFLRHIANSAAILRHPQWQFDMVRLGIGLYGVDSGKTDRLILEEVSSLKTTIAQIHVIDSSETVGYNRRGVLQRKSRIATVRIGYADGYNRRFGNGVGYMLVHGQKATIIGSVCMDMTMIDVTDIPMAKEGDEVMVFGNGISITELAKWAGTIPYEIMTSISERVKRVYIEAT